MTKISNSLDDDGLDEINRNMFKAIKSIQSGIGSLINATFDTKKLLKEIADITDSKPTFDYTSQVIEESLSAPDLKDFVWSNEVSNVFYVRKKTNEEKVTNDFVPGLSESNMLTLDSMAEVAEQMTDPNWLTILNYQATRLEEIAEVMKAMAIAARLNGFSDDPTEIENDEGDWTFKHYGYFASLNKAPSPIKFQMPSISSAPAPSAMYVDYSGSIVQSNNLTPEQIRKINEDLDKSIGIMNNRNPSIQARPGKIYGPTGSEIFVTDSKELREIRIYKEPDDPDPKNSDTDLSGRYDPNDPLGFKTP